MDWANHRWVIHRHKSSRTAKVSKPKLIPMCPCVENLTRWLHAKQGDQPYVFLNSRGQPQGLRTRFLGDLSQYSQQVVVLPARQQAASVNALSLTLLLGLEQTQRQLPQP